MLPNIYFKTSEAWRDSVSCGSATRAQHLQQQRVPQADDVDSVAAPLGRRIVHELGARRRRPLSVPGARRHDVQGHHAAQDRQDLLALLRNL